MSNDKMREAFEGKNYIDPSFCYHGELNIYVFKGDSAPIVNGGLVRLNEDWGLWQIAWQDALQSQQPESEPVEVARLFHTTYERLAPDYGYETREDTQVFDPMSANGRLMTAVCAHIMQHINFQPAPQVPEGFELVPLHWRQDIEIAIGIMDETDFHSGVCFCGDYIESHGMGSGHNPADKGADRAAWALAGLKALLDLSSSAPSIANGEEREWIQGPPVYEGDGGILHIPLQGCPNYLAVGFVAENGGLEDQLGNPIGYEADAVEKWIEFLDIPLAGVRRVAPPAVGA